MVVENTYGYDSASNRTWRENTLTHGTTPALDEYYTYDGLNRLKDVDRGTLAGTHPNYTAPTSPTFQQDWGLSATGNWATFNNNGTNQTRTHNLVNEVTAVSNWLNPQHDKAGNMTLAPRPGNETSTTEGLVNTYDSWNRLRKVEKNDATLGTGGVGGISPTPATPATLIAQYEYDGIHRRIRKIIYEQATKDEETEEETPTTPTTPTVDYVIDYYYNTSWQVLEIRLDGDEDPLKQYAWDIRYIDAPIVRWHDSDTDGTIDDTLYYTNDANMNVTSLIDPSTQAVVERYSYDPYGKLTVYDASWTTRANGTAYDNEVLYCGYRRDYETGLDHVRIRPYHCTMGRFIVADPSHYPDGMNHYQYCISDPLSHTDWLGEAPGATTQPSVLRRYTKLANPYTRKKPALADYDGHREAYMEDLNKWYNEQAAAERAEKERKEAEEIRRQREADAADAVKDVADVVVDVTGEYARKVGENVLRTPTSIPPSTSSLE